LLNPSQKFEDIYYKLLKQRQRDMTAKLCGDQCWGLSRDQSKFHGAVTTRTDLKDSKHQIFYDGHGRLFLFGFRSCMLWCCSFRKQLHHMPRPDLKHRPSISPQQREEFRLYLGCVKHGRGPAMETLQYVLRVMVEGAIC
jgi:hypothetical protein